MIWKKKFTIDDLNRISQKTMVEHVGIKFTKFSDDSLTAEMPVDERTFQPAKIMHGGASVVLAETLGSVATSLCLDNPDEMPVGVEINANHIRAMKSGKVIGTAKPLHMGRRTHVWEIRIESEEGKLVCVSRITSAIVNKKI